MSFSQSFFAERFGITEHDLEQVIQKIVALVGREISVEKPMVDARMVDGSRANAVYAPVGWATHYHADYVVPYWAATMAKNTVVGAHLFYRWSGGWGQPSAFSKDYGGREPSAAALRAKIDAVLSGSTRAPARASSTSLT